MCATCSNVKQCRGRIGNTYFMQDTVNKKLRESSRCQRGGVEKVAKLHKSFGYPSMQDMMNAIRNGTIVNCPLTPDDVTRYSMVFQKKQ